KGVAVRRCATNRHLLAIEGEVGRCRVVAARYHCAVRCAYDLVGGSAGGDGKSDAVSGTGQLRWVGNRTRIDDAGAGVARRGAGRERAVAGPDFEEEIVAGELHLLQSVGRNLELQQRGVAVEGD